MSRFHVNEGARRRRTADGGRADDVAAFHRSMPGYRPARLVELPSLARDLGVASLLVKDLSCCFGLPAFRSWARRGP